MKKKPQDVCYWCGGEPVDREHVPPLNIFPKEKRVNLITVPSCKVHNKDFEKLDERMRIILQGGCDSAEAKSEFFKTTKRGMERKESAGLIQGLSSKLIPSNASDGTFAEMTNVQDDLQNYFEKITRGLYYYHYATPFPGGECVIIHRQSFASTKELLESYNSIAPLFAKNGPALDSKSLNPEIFKYRYCYGTGQIMNMFNVSMIFYNDLEVISTLITTPPDDFDSLKIVP